MARQSRLHACRSLVTRSCIQVTAFDGNKIAVVFRDENKDPNLLVLLVCQHDMSHEPISQGNAGALVVGTVEEAPKNLA